MPRIISQVMKAGAFQTMALRAGIVALNFGIMIGLAASMGLAAFGALAVIWGFSLIASTAMSLGGPLLLLSRLNDGTGLTWATVFLQVVAGPAVLAAAAHPILHIMLPDQPWAAILATGFGINLITCLASMMRALGSVQMSMALRDAGPQVALGIAAIMAMGTDAAQILMQAVLWLALLGIIAGTWCICHPNWTQIVRRAGASPRIHVALWGTSVLGMGLAQVDIVVGGSFLSPEHIGLYALLKRIANLVALPVSVATWVSAGPVTAAFGAGDQAKLRQAAAKGSQIALIPGMALFLLAIASLPLFDVVTGQAEGRAAFVILAAGAFAQVVFASGFTVATLCGQAGAAALARAVSIALYLAFTFILGAGQLGLAGNAGLYVIALSSGSILLWAVLRRRLGVDTSAAVLWGRRAGAWTFS